MLGDKCSSRCPTKDHSGYGECLRAKGVAVIDPQGRVHRTAWDKEMSAYESARRQGVQPASTNIRDISAAMKISEATGQPYQA